MPRENMAVQVVRTGAEVVKAGADVVLSAICLGLVKKSFTGEDNVATTPTAFIWLMGAELAKIAATGAVVLTKKIAGQSPAVSGPEIIGAGSAVSAAVGAAGVGFGTEIAPITINSPGCFVTAGTAGVIASIEIAAKGLATGNKVLAVSGILGGTASVGIMTIAGGDLGGYVGGTPSVVAQTCAVAGTVPILVNTGWSCLKAGKSIWDLGCTFFGCKRDQADDPDPEALTRRDEETALLGTD